MDESKFHDLLGTGYSYIKAIYTPSTGTDRTIAEESDVASNTLMSYYIGGQ